MGRPVAARMGPTARMMRPVRSPMAVVLYRDGAVAVMDALMCADAVTPALVDALAEALRALPARTREVLALAVRRAETKGRES